MRRSYFVLLFSANCASTVFGQILGQQSLSQSSYVIDNKSQLYSWGSNHDGQLGIGSTTDQNRPILVARPLSITSWVLIAAGTRHALAVGDSDKLYGWGYNSDGEIGNGTLFSQFTPGRVQNPAGVTSWKAISAGDDHSMALASNGMIYVWGSNAHGQLGLGDRTNHASPQLLPLPPGVSSWVHIAAGKGYSVGVSSAGDIYYWGLQRGVDSLRPYKRELRSRVASPVTSVAAGQKIVGDIQSDGLWRVFNADIGTFVDSILWFRAAGVANGASSELLLTTEGRVYRTPQDSLKPHEIFFPGSVTQWTAVAAGFSHYLTMGNDGYLYAWGDNTYGQLGDGSGMNQPLPVRVMKFGDSLNIDAMLSAVDHFSGVSFPVTLQVANVTGFQGVANPTGYLTLSTPMRYGGADPVAPLNPGFITIGQTANAGWNVTADSVNGIPDSIEYFAYITAKGSAPLLVSNKMWVDSRANSRHLLGYVRDSLRQQPLDGALLWFSSRVIRQPHIDTTRSRSDGSFFIPHSNLNGYDMVVMRQNYAVREWILDNPETDTFYTPFDIPPSTMIGNFLANTEPGVLPTKTAFPDSLIGYGVHDDLILRTTNGQSWKGIFSMANAKFEDIAFKNVHEGWAVGATGLVLHTTNDGSEWASEAPPALHSSLHAIASFNDERWAVGDTGVMLHQKGNGAWTIEPRATEENLYTVSFFDSANGVAAGSHGIVLRYENGNWISLSSGKDYALRASTYPIPTRFWVAGDSGMILPYIRGASFPASVPEPTFTSHTMRSLAFVNGLDGFVTGDSGSNFVTYDSGHYWAPLDISEGSSALSFFSTVGHAAGTSSNYTYRGGASPIAGIIRGRQFDRDNISGIAGITVILYGPTNIPYVNYTNNLGNYVFTGLPPGVYSMDFKVPKPDGNIITTHYTSLSVTSGSMVDRDNYYPGAAVNAAPNEGESMSDRAPMRVFIDPVSSDLRIEATPDALVRVEILDVLGRAAAKREGVGAMSIDMNAFASGSYFYHLTSRDREASGQFVVRH